MAEQKEDINERRINVFVSPEAKRMLRELGEKWHPNLKRPDGTVLERIIREAYRRMQVDERRGGEFVKVRVKEVNQHD